MIARVALVAAVVGLAALAFWHPAPRPPIERAVPTLPTPDLGLGGYSRAHPRHRGVDRDAGDQLVVYVAGAVKRPGLYHLRSGDRYAQAVALAGGLSATGDGAGVNLAAHANDGDEIYVPVVGEMHHPSSERRGRRHAATPPPNGSVDINQAGAAELAAVPGIGRAIGQRIVELRQREGRFASLDELLDVAGMTQTRLERARPYLREL